MKTLFSFSIIPDESVPADTILLVHSPSLEEQRRLDLLASLDDRICAIAAKSAMVTGLRND